MDDGTRLLEASTRWWDATRDDPARLVAWLTVASVGTILAALGLYGPAAWSAGLYYLLNSTLDRKSVV